VPPLMLLADVEPESASPEIPAETPVPPLPPELRASLDAEPELLLPVAPPLAEPVLLLPEVPAPPVAVPLLWELLFVLVPPSAEPVVTWAQEHPDSRMPPVASPVVLVPAVESPE